MNEKVKIAILALLVALGVFLVFLSSSQKGKDTDTNLTKDSFDEAVYEQELEARLTELVGKIDGVGTVSVMVTLDGSALYTFAQNSVEDVSSDGDFKSQADIVLSSKGTSTKEAVISGYTLPKIKGAAVVCSNKLSAKTIEKIIGVVSASLGISTDKIYVTN